MPDMWNIVIGIEDFPTFYIVEPTAFAADRVKGQVIILPKTT